MNIYEHINLAFQHYQEGKFELTVEDCSEILKEQPDNVDILHLMGVTSYQLGQYDHALEYLNNAVQRDDQNADIFYDLGNVLQEQGNVHDAGESYKKAIEIEPEYADAHNNLGIILHDQGNIEEAIIHYQKSLEIAPHNPSIHNNLGLAFQEQGEMEKAIAHFGRAIQIDPNHADACFNMGNVFMKAERLDQAFLYFRKALQCDPNLVEAYISMAHILVRQEKFPEAIPFLRMLVNIYPDVAEMHNNLGNALGEIWQLDEGLMHLQRAIQLDPAFGDAHNNLGNIYEKMGRLDEALKCFNKAIDLDPQSIEAYNNLGNVLKEKGNFNEAKACYEKALAMSPNNADLLLNISIMQLFAGNLREGWQGYEWRWNAKGATVKNFPIPLWDGTILKGKTLFVYAEQGIGDEIMFASCLPEVIEQSGLCIVECDSRFIPLYERSFHGAKIIAKLDSDKYPADIPHTDFIIPVGSLPRFLRPDLASFPQRKSYFVADGEKVKEWKIRYEEMGNGLKVGICWRGGSKPDTIRVRSTKLEHWAKIFLVSGVTFINLQYGDCSEELKEAKEKLGVSIHDWEDADPLKDLDSFAAQIAALDIVISVDNATVHMAGALGVPVWVLLPYVCEWRWMQEYEDTPWYKTMRLFRQSSDRDWQRVFERVHQCLLEAVIQETLTEGNLVFPPTYSYHKRTS